MDFHEILNTLPHKKMKYFKHKFPELHVNSKYAHKTDDDFLKSVELKTMYSFERWERTEEYKNLVALYLKTKMANDFLEIYSNVSEKAKEGDEKSIKLFLSLQKDVEIMSKIALNYFKYEELEEQESDEDDYDDLVLS